MRLSKVLLVAGAGVLVYKVLKSVKIVKVDFSEELPQEFELATEVIREVYGKELAKNFEKAMKDNGSKTILKMDEKLVELFAEKFENATKEKVVELARERPISMQEASHEIASEVQRTTDKAKELIEDYHKNYKEVTV